MDIVVRCYGNVREAIGLERIELAVDRGATVSDVLEALAAEHVGFDRFAGDETALVVMRNGVHLDSNAELADGDMLNISTSPMPE